jgi:hypothetical protein
VHKISPFHCNFKCHVTSLHLVARSFAFRRLMYLISTQNWLICNHYLRAKQTSRSVIALSIDALVSVRFGTRLETMDQELVKPGEKSAVPRRTGSMIT